MSNGTFRTMPYVVTVVNEGDALIGSLNDGCTYNKTSIINWIKPENTSIENIIAKKHSV